MKHSQGVTQNKSVYFGGINKNSNQNKKGTKIIKRKYIFTCILDADEDNYTLRIKVQIVRTRFVRVNLVFIKS